MLTKFHIRPDEELKLKIIHSLKNLIDIDDLMNKEGHIENESIYKSITNEKEGHECT